MKRSFDDHITILSARRGSGSSKNLLPTLEKFGYPNLSFPSIHIAGTNGKGSVSCKTAKGLELSGKKVGLFTSPHIKSFCERIQINGKKISEKRVEQFIQQIAPFSLTFFETAFLMACLYFREQKVDYAVMEAGIGGRFDTTNCLRSILSVITSIGFDHKEILGETLEQIADQKAGIIRPGHTVFIGASADYPCMYNPDWTTYAFPKQANYECENRALAEAVLKHLGIERETRLQALEASMPCRFEQIGEWVFDIAHNPPGIEALLNRLPAKATFYIGFSKSKEIDKCLRLLVPRAYECVLLPVDRSDMKSRDEIIPFLQKYTLPNTFEEVIQLAKTKAPPHVVCGSAYVMEPLRSLLTLESLVK